MAGVHDLGVFRHRGRTHEVRPRLVWLGLGGLLVGTAVAGVGVATGSWPLGIGGAVVLLVSAAVAVRGGFFYDITSGSARSVVDDIRDDTVRRGPDPLDRTASPPVVARVRAVEKRRLEAVHQPWTAPSPVRFAAIALLTAGAYLVVSQGPAYSDTPEGDVGTQRAVAAGIVVLLAAIRILSAGHSRVASAFAWVAGAAMMLSGLVATHDAAWSQWSELVAGAAVVLTASVTFAPPRRPDE